MFGAMRMTETLSPISVPDFALQSPSIEHAGGFLGHFFGILNTLLYGIGKPIEAIVGIFDEEHHGPWRHATRSQGFEGKA